jgi:fatty-acyl-CoA synthase
MDAPTTLPALLDQVSTTFATREALVSVRRRLTYAALAIEAEAATDALAARGVGLGTRVGLLMPNWPEWIVLAFGVWGAGGVLVPLSTLVRPPELGHCLTQARVEVLLAVRRFLHHDYEAVLDAARARGLPALREVVWLDDAFRSLAPAGDRPRSRAAMGPREPATVFFTSGTTAAPKGVVHLHGGLCRGARDIGILLGITPEDRTWGYLPFFFAGGLVAVALATLTAGGAIVLQEVFEPGETLRLLEQERCTTFFAWPHQAEALLAHPRFATTRLFLEKGVGANTKWAARLYPPEHHAVGTFGMTETGPLFTAWPWDAPQALRAASHGPPLPGREVRIVDPESGTPLPHGREGEICVRGPTLFAHYDDEPPSACVDADGFFHTGDLGRLDDAGALHFLGRLKDVVKSAGANVAAAEVEAVLMAHPAVGAAHVVGVPDPLRGENVAAFVVPSGVVEADELLTYCRERLSSYKVPRHVWFRREDALPVKGSGKVDKARLRAEAVALVTGDDGRSGSPPAAPA